MNLVLSITLIGLGIMAILRGNRVEVWKRRHQEMVKHCDHLLLAYKNSDETIIRLNANLQRLSRASAAITEHRQYLEKQFMSLRKENDDLEIRYRQSRDDYHRANAVAKAFENQLIDLNKRRHPMVTLASDSAFTACRAEKGIPSDGKL